MKEGALQATRSATNLEMILTWILEYQTEASSLNKASIKE